eukprot:GGOE01043984.1.p3 GENE.GGOE01043984.1~~GGOE01043984.1.p3  ORF type:complete len:104 (-),score=3.48 GGOE01043984.1:27-338(-)
MACLFQLGSVDLHLDCKGRHLRDAKSKVVQTVTAPVSINLHHSFCDVHNHHSGVTLGFKENQLSISNCSVMPLISLACLLVHVSHRHPTTAVSRKKHPTPEKQ